jgi:hypothetical protein
MTYELSTERRSCDLCPSTADVQGRLCRRHRTELFRRSERERWARNQRGDRVLKHPLDIDIADYVEDALDAEHREAVAAHLRNCHPCTVIMHRMLRESASVIEQEAERSTWGEP